MARQHVVELLPSPNPVDLECWTGRRPRAVEQLRPVRAVAQWEALVSWLHRFVGYVATKRALAEELLHDSEIFSSCRAETDLAGEPMMRRAQSAGKVRADVSFDDVVRLLSGLTMAQFRTGGQRYRVLDVALDGLRPPTPARS